MTAFDYSVNKKIANAVETTTLKGVKKNQTVSVRLDVEQIESVKRLAKKFRVAESDIIRWAVDALIEYVELHNGHLHLPIDFTLFWERVEIQIQKHRPSSSSTPPPPLEQEA